MPANDHFKKLDPLAMEVGDRSQGGVGGLAQRGEEAQRQTGMVIPIAMISVSFAMVIDPVDGNSIDFMGSVVPVDLRRLDAIAGEATIDNGCKT